MASNFPEERQFQLSTRKGHDMTWSCDIHGEPISFHCKEHNISICCRCAIKEHCQKPCQLDDIGDVILEMGRQLEDTLLEIEEMKTRLKKLDSKMQSCATVVSNHFESINDNVHTVCEAKLRSVKDAKRDEIRVINEEADEKIRILNEEADEKIRILNEEADEKILSINEKRDKHITACSLEAGEQQLIIKDSQAKLISDSKTINRAYVKRVEDLQIKNKHEADTLDNMSCNINRIKQVDRTLVNGAAHIIASLDESLRDEVHQENKFCIDKIQREVQKVKVVEGKVGDDHYTRIDGYIGTWELVDIRSMNFTLVCGLISNDEIVLDSNHNDLQVTYICSEGTNMVIEGTSNVCVTSCVPLDCNVIVCGKSGCWPGDSLDRCITLYDRQWKVVRDITIPNNTSIPWSSVYIDVGRDGMIVAAQNKQMCNIYVINPADGKTVNTITMQGKTVIGPIQALSSGDMVVQTGGNEFTVISRSGVEKATIQCDEWDEARCCVDKLTDTLYIRYIDGKRPFYAVDQVSCDGIIEAKRIVEYPVIYDYPHSNYPCLITPYSGNLVVSNRDELLVYKKSVFV